MLPTPDHSSTYLNSKYNKNSNTSHEKRKLEAKDMPIYYRTYEAYGVKQGLTINFLEISRYAYLFQVNLATYRGFTTPGSFL